MTRAATLLLYLLSVHVATHAWVVGNRGGLAVVGGLLLVAVAAGRLGAGRGGRLPDPLLTGAAVLGRIAYAVFLLLLLVVAVDRGVAALDGWVAILVAVQCLGVFRAALGRGASWAHVNGLALVTVPTLAGGTVAAVATTGYAAIVAVWLVFEHHGRLGASLRQTTLAAIPPTGATVAALAIAFWWMPPEPYVPTSRSGPGAGLDARPVWIQLHILSWLVLGGLLLAALRLGWERRTRTAEEAVAADTGDRTEWPLPTVGAAEAVSLPPRNTRVVRLYLDCLRKLRRRGVHCPPHWTPRELAGRLPRSAHPLTEIFLKARFGPEEVTEEDCDAAARSARDTLAAVESRG